MDRRLFPLFYKVAAEALLLLIFVGLLYFMAEAIFPGFFSSRINFSTLYIALIVLISVVGWLGSRVGFFDKTEEKYQMTWAALWIGLLIITFLLLDLQEPWSVRNLLISASIFPAVMSLTLFILWRMRS